jgi:hypothetical protein
MNSKIKIYNYSQKKFITKLGESELFERFEVTEHESMSPTEILAQNYDVIELSPNDFEVFKDHVLAVDWKTSQLGMADCLIRQKNGAYRPMNLISVTILDLLKKSKTKINSQLPALVIGEFHFVYAVCVQLALSGFIEIIASITDSEESYGSLLEKKIRAFIFDLNLRIVNINELTTSELVGALLISDFKKELNKDAYDLLTYFNFLSQGALFIDCNSINEPSLVDDARKAEIAVIDEGQLITRKYNYLLEHLKISS